MNKKIIQKTVYEAYDGRHFESEKEAESWERCLRAKEYVKTLIKVDSWYLIQNENHYQTLCLANTGGMYRGKYFGCQFATMWVKVRMYCDEDGHWVDDNEILYLDHLQFMFVESGIV